ncbi:MAG: Gfo/Idh/MocA family oxidoreductase [Deinococcus sp.]|nr:Gfo/Idh/MocA family oxidoreductase [Deinococcus sp.]
MGKLRAAVIGAGFIGPAHVEALRRLGIEVAGITASTPKSAKRRAERLNLKAYGSWEDMIADKKVDVIHNCAPNHLHYPINKAALEAGKHVFSEKPLTISSQESAELVALAERRGLLGGLCHNYRGYPLVREAKERIAAGELGQLYHIHGHYLQDWLLYPADYNWRLEVAQAGRARAVGDIGSHWFDLAQYVSGLRLEAVLAETSTALPHRLRPKGAVETFAGPAKGELEEYSVDTDDYAAFLLRFSHSVKGYCAVSQVAAGHKNDLELEINGAQSSLRWNQERPEELWLGRRDQANGLVKKNPAILSAPARALVHYPVGHTEGYPSGIMNIIAQFYRALDGDQQADYPTFADGHRLMLIIEAVLESARSHKWVTIKG